MKRKTVPLLCFFAISMISNTKGYSQSQEKKPAKAWYETISLRGYVQVRYNRLFETNKSLKCEQCDRSWGENGGLSIRRGRLIFSGNLTEKVYF
ncbi:MAG: porin, partial [Bacteroidota bacterium]